jgi:hypothetical protein
LVSYLEGDVVVLGVDLDLLRQAVRVLRLQKVDADSVVEQPVWKSINTC